jgi:phosphoadenosine phosphosulfate reductase
VAVTSALVLWQITSISYIEQSITRYPAATMTATPLASTSAGSPPRPPPFDSASLDAVNASLSDATPQQILKYAVENLPNLYQTTAFGLTGLAATDMLARLGRKQPELPSIPLIFIDTLYHFQETLDLCERVKRKYNAKLHVFTPPGVSTTAEFEAKYGDKLWETDEDTYDYLVKVS